MPVTLGQEFGGFGRQIEKCPFCPGNEDKTPSAVMVKGEGTDWRIRVVPNKFAAVNPDLSPTRDGQGRFLSVEGFGVAEVIIESPLHNADISGMSTQDVKEILETYKNRAKFLREMKVE